MSQVTPAIEALLNKCEPGNRIIAFAVPTRIIRMVQVGEDALTFRIEQLVEHGGFGTPNPKGAWTTLSSHSSDKKIPGESLGPAFGALIQAQKILVARLTAKMKARNGVQPNAPTKIIRPH
jgi:hypothetical protein